MKHAWADYIVFSLFVLLLFLLLFRESIEVPPLLIIAGRLHPVVLHFPIVLIILAVFKTWRDGHPGKTFLAITTMLTLITAISGLLLYSENNGASPALNSHMWTGSALAIAVSTWFWINGLKIPASIRFILIGSVSILVLATGHLGGTVTHGKDFLSVPRTVESVTPDQDPEIFASFINPLFETKCRSCHNQGKMKGGLLLSDPDAMLRGGESGPALVAGAPEESLLLQRMVLPVDDEHHMPPAGKAQPSREEIQLVSAWIAAGAPDSLPYSQLNTNNPLYSAVSDMMKNADDSHARWSELPNVAENTIEALTNDYRTIKRVWGAGNALSVSIFPHEHYTAETLTGLKEIRNNIVELDLSGIPLGTGELSWIAQCRALERLDLDHTTVNDQVLAVLAETSSLRHLKLHHTTITDRSVEVLASMPALKSMYLYNTDVSAAGLDELRRRRPDIHLEGGIGITNYFADIDTAQSADPIESREVKDD